MKKFKLLVVLAFIICATVSLTGDIVAVSNINTVKSSDGLFTDYDQAFEPISTTHEITCLENNTQGRFLFHKNAAPEDFNGNFKDGYTTYIRANSPVTGVEQNEYSGKFHAGDTFVLKYEGVAKYHDKLVDCIVTIVIRGPGVENPVSVNFTNYGAIGFHSNFYRGLTLFDTSGTEISYKFIYHDTGATIEPRTMYWSWGSLNNMEGISSANASTEYYLVEGADTTATNFNDGYSDKTDGAKQSLEQNWFGTSYDWAVGKVDQDCSDTWGVGDFEKTFVSMKVKSTDGIWRFRTLSHDFWFCPFLGPLGATAPNPEKFVTKTPTEIWNKDVEVFVGDRIKFKVDQKVQNRQQGGTGYMKYNSFSFVDRLPKEVEYQSARVVTDSGVDVTNKGHLSFDASTNTVRFDFSKDYLTNDNGGMRYVGETYSLIIDCIVDSDSVENRAFENKPLTIINNTQLTNEPVRVTPHYKRAIITLNKEDIETGKETQGDAKFENAEYSIYSDSNCTQFLEKLILDENGTATSKIYNIVDYRDGVYTYRENFYVKETKAPEGYLMDTKVYHVGVSKDEITDVQHGTITFPITSQEQVKKGSVEVVKSLHNDDNTDSDPATGCKLYLTLDSNEEVVYEAIIDEKGNAVFEEIPYGEYTITESEEARIAGYKLIDPEPVNVKEDKVRLYRILEENEIETYVRVIKKDNEENTVIPVANTRYKIWSYADNAYVEMMSYQDGLISVFETGAKGEFKTPETLPIGKYKLVELTPPQGYHNEDMDFEIKDGVFENSIENPVVVVEQKDTAQKARIKVSKTGEVLVGVKQETDKETGLEVMTPVYEERGLKGVTYTITAAEDIVTADGTVRMEKGESVEMVTNEDGIALSKELYLGTYTLQETETLEGYILNDKVETVVLDYRTNGIDEEGRTIVIPNYTVEYSYKNERIPYVLEFTKTFGNSEYNNIDKNFTEKVKFGLYTKNDILGPADKVLIKADSLLEVISVENGKAKATVEIPLGEYYIQELDIEGLPFEIDTTKYDFTFNPAKDSNVQNITINNGNVIDNPLIKGNLNFLKVTRKVYEANKELIDEIIKNNDIDKFNEFAKEYGLEGAKYQVYFKDANGEYQKLQVKSQENGEYEDVYFTTDSMGIDDMLLPYGTYYVKEVEAPVDHEVDPNYIEVKVSAATNISIVNDPKIKGKIIVKHVDIDTGLEIYPVENSEGDINDPYTTTDRLEEINDNYGAGFDIYELVEEKIPENKDGVYEKEEQEVIYYYKRYTGSLLVIKKDAETAERLPGCIFTIKDKVTGQVLVENAETDENGEYYIEEAPYGLYIFTEVKAPEGYEIEEGSVGAEFAISTPETIFEIVNTGDIAVVALSMIALASVLGIAFVIIKNRKAMN